jgi:RND family efflux transporter MFP subunit
VIAVARSADPATRTFQVEIEIDNQSYILKPGMFARSEITMQKFENIVIVPSKTVVARDSKDYVFVINGDRVNMREIVTGTEFDGFVEVEKGLTPGDTIVTVGQNYLDDGYKVNLVEVTRSNEGGSTL